MPSESSKGFLLSSFHRPSLLALCFVCVCLSLNSVGLFATPWTGSPPGFSLYGISQARILEWVAIPFSRGSSWPRNRTQVSHTAGRFFTVWATGKPASCFTLYQFWTMLIVPQRSFLSSACNVFFWGSVSTHSRFTTSLTSSRKPSSIPTTTSVLHKLLYESVLHCKTVYFLCILRA